MGFRWDRALCLVFIVGLAAGNYASAGERAAPEIPFEKAEVASPDGRNFEISWDAPGVRRLAIYAGTDPADIDEGHPLATGKGTGHVRVSRPAGVPRWYFELIPDRGDPLIVADRSLRLSTAANFRDIGGYRTGDGHWVRMGQAYRSNELDRLTPDELDVLGRLGLKLDCDLRTEAERRQGPDRVPPGVTEISADVMADLAAQLLAMMTPTTGNGPAQKPGDVSRPTYRDFVDLASAQNAYHLLFTKLADPRQLPAVFHCSAGKDRTGWAAAVLLTILGVPRETVVGDYQLTDRYLRGEALKTVRARFKPGPAANQKFAADPADLDMAFAEVDRRFGSFDNYVHRGLGLDDATLEAIRRNFLAD